MKIIRFLKKKKKKGRSCLVNEDSLSLTVTLSFLLPASGGSVNPLWVHGRTSAQRQHGADRPLLCYLDCGSDFPRFDSDAIRLRWFTHQKGKKPLWGPFLVTMVCRFVGLVVQIKGLGITCTKTDFLWMQFHCISSQATVVVNLKYLAWHKLDKEINEKQSIIWVLNSKIKI